jgi:Stress responsive A/B Barrel Domain
MTQPTRRSFIAKTSLLALGATTTALAAEPSKPMLTHHVFFWLKNPASKEDQAKLVEGVKTLEKIETIRQLHIGVPASTEKRPVVDNSYAVSELIFFDDVAGQNTYQDHPIHKKFVADYSNLWEKVIVYDSMSI